MGAQLSLKDVITKVVAPPNMIRAMKMNRIDAFIVAEPFGAKAQSSGVGKILVMTKDIVPNHVECIVVVKQDLIEQQAQAVQEWVNSLLRAGRWIDKDKMENNAKQTAHLAVKYLPHSEDSIISGLENPKDRISFTDLNPDKADFQTIVDMAIQAHLIDKVNLEAFIDKQFYLASKLR
jgi:NitT/TauT family transport system substrate-binding protein